MQYALVGRRVSVAVTWRTLSRPVYGDEVMAAFYENVAYITTMIYEHS